MKPKNTAVPLFVLAACILMCACTTADRFTIRNTSGPAGLEEQQLVLKEPCRYVAGLDISGSLSPGPLQADAIGIPRPSNARVKEPVYLIQVGDLAVHGVYNITSFIGVRKNGAFVPNIILHSDVPGAEPFASESSKIRFTPENCHYSMEAAKAR